jgi:integrase
MSVKPLETGAGVGADQVVLTVSGAVQVTGQRPLSPVVLSAGEACGAVVDGGLNGTIVYVPKKGLTIQNHPKSANSRQKYFLPSFAVEMLLRRQIGQLEANPWDVVFPSAVGSLRDPNNFRRQWRSASLDHGFPWAIPHTFRKTVGTLLEASSGLAVASAQLGHSSENVTTSRRPTRHRITPRCWRRSALAQNVSGG